MFDADSDVTKIEWRATAKADNERLLKLLNIHQVITFPGVQLSAADHVIWPTNIGNAVQAHYSTADWQKWKSETEGELGQCGGLEKNSMCIVGILEKAWSDGKLSKTLASVCDQLVAFDTA